MVSITQCPSSGLVRHFVLSQRITLKKKKKSGNKMAADLRGARQQDFHFICGSLQLGRRCNPPPLPHTHLLVPTDRTVQGKSSHVLRPSMSTLPWLLSSSCSDQYVEVEEFRRNSQLEVCWVVQTLSHSTPAPLWMGSDLSACAHSSNSSTFPSSLFYFFYAVKYTSEQSCQDLNSRTCFSLLDTVNPIGRECTLVMSNRRAAVCSPPANGRREMFSVNSLSLREGGESVPGQLAP